MRTFAFFIVLAITSLVNADVITLKDGTQYEGQVVKNGDTWWIRTNDGKTINVSVMEVTSVSSGTIEGNKRPAGVGVAPPAPGVLSYNGTKAKADAAETALAAIAIWEKFLEATAVPAERDAALGEIANYMKLTEQGAEKINGKYLSGDQRKDILKKATDLSNEGSELVKTGKIPGALKKMEDAGKFYPNSYPLIFQVGFTTLQTKEPRDATKWFDMCVRFRPYSPEALSNLAFLILANQGWERGMTLYYQAAQTADSETLAKNMAKTLFGLPPEVRNNPRLKAAIECTNMLTARYKLDPKTDWEKARFTILSNRMEPIEGYQPYSLGLQTGAGVIVHEDGLILTSRHVVEHADVVMVVLDDTTRRIAEVLAMDPEQNLALLRIKPTQKLKAMTISKLEAPAEKDRAFAYGFGRIEQATGDPNLVEGVIRDKSRVVVTNDVVFDGGLSPGFSGGPLIDTSGQIAALVSFRDYCSATDNKLASALSSGRLKAFLARNKVIANIVEPGPAMSAEEITVKCKPSIVKVIVANRPFGS